jgi:FkbM family methyltransferase
MTAQAPLKPTLMSWLQLRPEFHRAITRLRLVELASKILNVRPLRRTLPSGVKYRVRYGESLLMADEIFKRQVYRDPFEGRRVRSFVDLGSNVGYFTCYAMGRTSGDVVGLSVDANPRMAEETAWHIAQNGRARVKGVWGVVGYPPESDAGTFYLNPSNVSGSATVLNPNIPPKGAQEAITVPTVDVNKAWRAHAGDLPVDVLKVDVEGFELEVLRTIPELLARTNAVVLEWHKWITDRAPIDALLDGAGLRFETVVTEDPHCGVAYYRRPVAI